ncbi:MAG TPA: cobalamin-binding protein [Thermoplasmata archaeon]|nr:cobalamin-binding protein [Thermoplasmata archaeon]
MRVVSLLPSATEIVCALGEQESLVGRSADCDYPDTVRSVPVVMRPREVRDDEGSDAIDARVRRSLARRESLYTLDVERLAGLRPDLILTQDLCAVCSVTPAEVSAACARGRIEPRQLSLDPRRLAEVWESVRAVGDAIDRGIDGARLADRLADRVRPTGAARLGRVAVVEWLDPPILAGLWTPDIVRAAGGEPVGPAAGAPGERTTWADLAAADVDRLVVSPCSFSVERTRTEIDRRRTVRDGIASVTPDGRALLVDEALFSRPGPRLADGVSLFRRLPEGPAPAPGAAIAWSPTGG